MYSLEYTEIPKVFFMPHHRQWCQHVNQRNHKGNSGIWEHCCNNVIQGQCCNSVIQQWPLFTVATMFSNNDLGSYCCNNVLQQSPWFTLMQQCAPTMTPFYSVAMCSNNDLGSHCCNNVFQQWPQFTLLQHTVTPVCFNNHLGSHCCNMLQHSPQFPLLQQCFPTTRFTTLQQCAPTMFFTHTVATVCFSNGLSSHCCNFSNDLGSHCCKNVLQQWPQVMQVA
jgi:hypothetical protein